jgi:hypothetical protein
LIGVATLTGSTDRVPVPWCIPCALRQPGLAADLIANVLLFIPLGVGLRVAGLRAAAVLAAALALSLAVELVQAYIVSGRVANLLDVGTNTVGAVVGTIAAGRWRTVVLPSAKTATRLALVSAGALIAIVAASAWALTPVTAPAPVVVRGVGTRARPASVARVLSAVVDGRAIRGRDTVGMHWPQERPIRIDVALQASPSRGDAALRFVAGGRRVLLLGIEREELKLELRRKGAALRLLSPYVRVPYPVRQTRSDAIEELDTLVLRAVAAPWRLSLAVQAGAAHDAIDVRLHPLAGWSLLVPHPHSAWLGNLLTALWTGLLVFPVAYWSAAATSQARPMIGALLSLSVAAVLAIGAVVRAPWPPWLAVSAAFVAALAAWRLRATIPRVTASRRAR